MAAKKKTTTKKSTTKKPKNVTIQYSPVGITAESFNVPLRKKQILDGSTKAVNVPLIEGLPMDLNFNKGDTMEVTPKQLEELQFYNIVESQEEHDKREAFIKHLPNQFPQNLNEVERAEREKTLLTAWDAQNKIYSDKLIIRD